jgi:hypothetical protein
MMEPHVVQALIATVGGAAGMGLIMQVYYGRRLARVKAGPTTTAEALAGLKARLALMHPGWVLLMTLITALFLLPVLAFSLERTAWVMILVEGGIRGGVELKDVKGVLGFTLHDLGVLAASVIEGAVVGLIAVRSVVDSDAHPVGKLALRGLRVVLSLQVMSNLFAGFLRGAAETDALIRQAGEGFGWDMQGSVWGIALRLVWGSLVWLLPNAAVPWLSYILAKALATMIQLTVNTWMAHMRAKEKAASTAPVQPAERPVAADVAPTATPAPAAPVEPAQPATAPVLDAPVVQPTEPYTTPWDNGATGVPQAAPLSPTVPISVDNGREHTETAPKERGEPATGVAEPEISAALRALLIKFGAYSRAEGQQRLGGFGFGPNDGARAYAAAKRFGRLPKGMEEMAFLDLWAELWALPRGDQAPTEGAEAPAGVADAAPEAPAVMEALAETPEAGALAADATEAPEAPEAVITLYDANLAATAAEIRAGRNGADTTPVEAAPPVEVPHAVQMVTVDGAAAAAYDRILSVLGEVPTLQTALVKRALKAKGPEWALGDTSIINRRRELISLGVLVQGADGTFVRNGVEYRTSAPA